MKFRSVFLSDLHLGTRACKIDFLLDFLNSISTENLFLVGDVVDLQCLSSRSTWSTKHGELLRRIVALSHQGTRIVYIPGNHDDPIREYANTCFGQIHVAINHVHRLADGRKLLLLHGDEFDFVVRHHKLLGILGAFFYAQLVALNRAVNAVRYSLGMDYWSLASYVKQRNRNVIARADNFKRVLCQYARSAGCDGVIAGHIHIAEIDTVDGILYFNPGDWVESCTAIAEDHLGAFKLIDWPSQSRELVDVERPLEEEEILGHVAAFLTPEPPEQVLG
jgi:UDP-2,3-diacylglucosamine pyrophosphatase LpxH